MIKWNEFGVGREADDSTYSELMGLRSAVHRYEKRWRDNEESKLLEVLKRIASSLETIEKKMGQ